MFLHFKLIAPQTPTGVGEFVEWLQEQGYAIDWDRFAPRPVVVVPTASDAIAVSLRWSDLLIFEELVEPA